jgi:fibrillarin-like pre-rRNA processing protein
MAQFKVKPHERIEGVYWVSLPGEREKLATANLAPGISVYGEMLYKRKDTEYRLWDPYRSKLAAAVLKGLTWFSIKPGSKVLYLGAASGTTASHVSDIVGEQGRVYCVEFAQRSFRDLVNTVCQNRPNTTPILEDARFPSKYRSIVPEVDIVYSDVAQPDQARIIADNLDVFLGKQGDFLLVVKARSVDVTREPKQIFREEASTLEERGYKVGEMVGLEPFEKDHCMLAGAK